MNRRHTTAYGNLPEADFLSLLDIVFQKPLATFTEGVRFPIRIRKTIRKEHDAVGVWTVSHAPDVAKLMYGLLNRPLHYQGSICWFSVEFLPEAAEGYDSHVFSREGLPKDKIEVRDKEVYLSYRQELGLSTGSGCLQALQYPCGIVLVAPLVKGHL